MFLFPAQSQVEESSSDVFLAYLHLKDLVSLVRAREQFERGDDVVLFLILVTLTDCGELVHLARVLAMLSSAL